MNITSSSQATGRLKIDGIPIPTDEFHVIGNSGFSYARVVVEPGNHRLESELPFGVAVYGFGDNDAYGYTGGTSLSPVADVRDIVVSPTTAVLLPNQKHFVSALVTDQAGEPVEGIKVDFAVNGGFERYLTIVINRIPIVICMHLDMKFIIKFRS